MSTSPEIAEQEDSQFLLKIFLVVCLSVLCIFYFRVQQGMNKLSRALDKDGDIGSDEEESEDEDDDEWGILPRQSSEEKDLLKKRIQFGGGTGEQGVGNGEV
ncbi:hypothetical protein CPB85DRAFT_1428807 [Mucidula mucida]|nr:hypothetical protein CPB85DRAFT_1428807 [Mucidula mucida]